MALDMDSIWERLDALLKERKLSYDKLAQELGISRNALYNARTRGNSLRLETIVGICQFLDITIDYLVLGDKEEAVDQEQINQQLSEVIEVLQHEPDKLRGVRLLLGLA